MSSMARPLRLEIKILLLNNEGDPGSITTLSVTYRSYNGALETRPTAYVSDCRTVGQSVIYYIFLAISAAWREE